MTGEHDIRFVREGRPLADWLPQLVAEDPASRLLAGDAIAAMFFNQPSVHSEYKDDGMSREQEQAYRADWAQAARESIQQLGPDRQAFLFSLAMLRVAMQEAYLQDLAQEDEQFNRVLDRLGERIDSLESEDAKRDQLKKIGRALCASFARDNESDWEPEALTMTGMAVAWVIPALGEVWMEAPESLHMLLETKGCESGAYEAIEQAGPAAAPHFLGMLSDQMRAAEHEGYFSHASVLAKVGRANPKVIAILLDAMRDWQADRLWSAASTLYHMGADARTHKDTMPLLLELLEAKDGQRRAAAAFVLGKVACGMDDVIEPLLKATHDPFSDPDADGSTVANEAMTSLGLIASRPDLVVPRLCEMFKTYNEHDCDMGYGGEYARVCEALACFGKNASPALPILLKLLQRDLRKDPSHWYHNDLLHLLGMIGPEAEEALPLLEAMEEKWQAYCDREEEWDDEEDYEDEDDDEEEEEEDVPEISEISKTICRIHDEASV